MIRIFILLFLFFTAPSARAQDAIMRLGEIRPGMKGYGLSVFEKIKVEKFDVEIIAVLKGSRPRSGLILARIGGHPSIEKAGVIAGMSGSPIYVEGKLIGALAFSWTFSKEPLTGITPIEDMLDIFRLGSPSGRSMNFEPSKEKFRVASDHMEVIPMPLSLGGQAGELSDVFKKEFREMNFLPVGGVSGSSEDLPAPERFQPGSSVAVNLITGDLNIAGIGTVTYTNKDRILIFGHPMFYSGSSDMPLAHAYIHTVVPTLMSSFKMGTATKITGRTVQDVLAGLAGRIGENAHMLPVEVNIDYFKNIRKYRYSLIRSYHYLPHFLTLALYHSIQMAGGYLEKNTLDFEFVVTLGSGRKIRISNTLAGLSTADTLKNSFVYLLTPLSFLAVNKYEKVDIRDVKVGITVRENIRIAEIKGILAVKRTYAPGETVKLKVRLRPYQGNEFTREIAISLPARLDEKKFLLVVSSDTEREYVDFLLSPQKYNPHNLDQLLRLYDSMAKSTDMAVWGMTREKGVVMNGEVIDRLPVSFFSMLQDSLDSGSERSSVQIKNRIPMDYLIVGSAMLTLDIKNPNE